MPRIAGRDIPENQKLEFALQALYGIGSTNVHQLIELAGLDPKKRAKELTDLEISQIHKALDSFLTEGELRRQIAQNITRHKTIGSYQGSRHKANLPVHGQRTKTNARTKRGKRMTVGAFKKSEISKMEQQSKTKERKEKGK